MLKRTLLKLFSFYSRSYVLAFGFLTSFAIVISLGRIDIALYLVNFITALVLIFPFRLLKSIKNLQIYFYLLFLVTVWAFFNYLLNILRSDVSLSDFLFLLAFSSNLYFVYLYISHRLNPKLINPLFEKKDYKLLFVPLFILVVIFSYIFVDIHTSPRGREFFVAPGIMPSAIADFNNKALTSGYLFDSSLYSPSETLYVKIIKNSIDDNDDFIELYENNQKIYRVDFNQQGIKTMTSYDKNGTSNTYTQDITTFQAKGIDGLNHEYKAYKIKFLGRDKNGKYREIPANQQSTAINKLDFIINSAEIPISYPPGSRAIPYKMKALEVTFEKSIDYPQRPKNIPLPFFRSKWDWKVSLKDSKGTLPVINSLHLWY